MRMLKALRGLGLVAGLTISLLSMTGAALAATTPGWECVPTTAGQAVVSGGTGAAPSCSAGTTAVLAPTYVSSGVGGKPTVQFSGVNVQLINGSGSETTINGAGNLILGYDPTPGTQTGSHNLLLGGEQSYSSYGGIVTGYGSAISAPYASVLGGARNSASGSYSTITGGYANKATTKASSVSGGCSNLAGSGTVTFNSNCSSTTLTDAFASIVGGIGNQAGAEFSAVSGGKENKATGEGSSVSGGGGGEASGVLASVTGGRLGKAPYFASTVLGGLEEVTEKEFGVTP